MTNKEAIEILTHTYMLSKERQQALDLAIKALEKRPKGKWIEHYDSQEGFTWLTCSRCMEKAYEEGYNYCPNCGADMRGEEENE